MIDVLVRRRRHLGLEGPPELLDARRDRRASRCARSSVHPRAGEQHVTGDVAPRPEPLSHVPYLRLVEISACTVEERHRLAHGEVAGRPGVGPPESPREEPVGGPATEPALRRDRLDDLRRRTARRARRDRGRSGRGRSRTRPSASRSRPRGSRSRSPRASRSRVGNAQASPVPDRRTARSAASERRMPSAATPAGP